MYQKCRHIKSNGGRCGAAALHDRPYCYFHTRLHRITRTPPATDDKALELPVPEDRSAIQIALAQVLSGLASSKLEPRRAGLMLYGLQIASQNVDRNPHIIPNETVKSVSQNEDGEELAPASVVCEGPEDCAACDEKDTCDDFESSDDDDDEDDDEESIRNGRYLAKILETL